MKFLVSIFLFFSAVFAEVIAPDKAFIVDTNASASEINLNFKIADEIYIYKDEIQILLGDTDINAFLNFPEPKEYKNHQIYDKNVSISVPMGLVFANAKNTNKFNITVKFLGCTVGGFCYEPQSRAFEFDKTESGYEIKQIQTSQNSQNLNQNENSTQTQILQIFENKSFFAVIFSFFVFGILLSLTPCIYPLIPILSSIIVAKTSHKPSLKTSLILSALYVLGIAVAYAILGVCMAIFGQNIQGALQSKFAIFATMVIFVVLAFSLFGFYEIKLPSKVQNYLNQKSNATSGFVGVFVMGAISALVVSPCISAPLAGALIYIANTANIALGASALFALGLGSGALLFAVGLGVGLPRAGAWMDIVPKLLGFAMLFVAVWIGRAIIGENLALLFYAILCALCAGFLGVFDKGANGIKRSVAFLVLIYSALLLVGFASGAKDFTKPLGALNFHSEAKSESANFIYVQNLSELKAQIANSSKPVIVDFWAQWCKNCEESEAAFDDVNSAGILSNFTLLKVDLTQNLAILNEIKKEFEVMGPPSILFFKNGAEVRELRQIGAVNSQELAQILAMSVRITKSV